MDSLGFWLSAVILVFAFIMTFLNAHEFKEATSKKRAKVGVSLVSALNLLFGIVSLWNASASGRKQTDALTELTQLQQTQIQKANDLADKLNAAQRTTKQISSRLAETSKNVGAVLSETERALQPLQNLTLHVELELPQSDRQVAELTTILHKTLAEAPVVNPFANPDPRLTLLTAPMRSLGAIYLPDTPLYPQPNTALGMLTKSIRVNVQFHERHLSADQYSADSRPKPDLSIDFVENTSQPNGHPSRWLQTNAIEPLFYVLMSRTSRAEWRSTGSILSVADLMKAQVVAQPVFAIPSMEAGKDSQIDLEVLAEAEKLWEGVKLHSLVLDTQDGRRWVFDVMHSKIVKEYNVPIFVGLFHRLIKPLDGSW